MPVLAQMQLLWPEVTNTDCQSVSSLKIKQKLILMGNLSSLWHYMTFHYLWWLQSADPHSDNTVTATIRRTSFSINSNPSDCQRLLANSTQDVMHYL